MIQIIEARLHYPNFFCVGTTKGGTTTMHHILKNHPQIYLPEIKETHFFDWDRDCETKLGWYIDNYFSGVTDEIAIGEIAPSYMHDLSVAGKLHKAFGDDLKLIFVFREPVARAYSAYLMGVRKGWESRTFEDALQVGIDDIEREKAAHRRFHYISRGFYDIQVEPYLKCFKRSNMLFLLFETEIIRNQPQTYAKIYEFLGVEPFEQDFNIATNTSRKVKSDQVDWLLNTANPINQLAKTLIPSKQMRHNIKRWFMAFNRKSQGSKSDLEKQKKQLIKEVYSQSIKRLESMTDLDLSNWLN